MAGSCSSADAVSDAVPTSVMWTSLPPETVVPTLGHLPSWGEPVVLDRGALQLVEEAVNWRPAHPSANAVPTPALQGPNGSLRPAMILSDRTIREELAAGRIIIEPMDDRDVQPSSVD